MGISLELWRARIGCFVMPRKCRTRVETLKPVFVSLAIRIVLFYLLVAEGVESNPGPNSQPASQATLHVGAGVTAVEAEVKMVAGVAVVVVADELGEIRSTYLRMEQPEECQARHNILNHATHYAIYPEVKISRQSVID